MAILPALFYAACLGHRKTVIVGDPCQLPSIVQSDEEYVRKVMGRNIFDVAVADPLCSPLVAMLDVQYRMHPLIGGLVSVTITIAQPPMRQVVYWNVWPNFCATRFRTRSP